MSQGNPRCLAPWLVSVTFGDVLDFKATLYLCMSVSFRFPFRFEMLRRSSLCICCYRIRSNLGSISSREPQRKLRRSTYQQSCQSPHSVLVLWLLLRNVIYPMREHANGAIGRRLNMALNGRGVIRVLNASRAPIGWDTTTPQPNPATIMLGHLTIRPANANTLRMSMITMLESPVVNGIKKGNVWRVKFPHIKIQK